MEKTKKNGESPRAEHLFLMSVENHSQCIMRLCVCTTTTNKGADYERQRASLPLLPRSRTREQYCHNNECERHSTKTIIGVETHRVRTQVQIGGRSHHSSRSHQSSRCIAIAIAIVIAVRNELDAVEGVLKVALIRRWCARDLPPIFRRSVPLPITSSPNK